MTTASQQADPFVILYGVSSKMYAGLLDAFDGHYLRHTYTEGTLELRALVHGLAARKYKQFLDVLGDYNLRHTYDGWTLEMMPPRKDHDWDKSFVGRIIETVAFALEIDIQCIGSTTLTSNAIDNGLQPDESYYIANEPLVRHKHTYEPDVDPPPDLILEVDVTSSSVPRMPLFAKLRIPEVWRFDSDCTRFYKLLKSGKYKEIDRSIAFPFIAPEDIDECLDKRDGMTENAVLRWFLDEVQKRLDKSNKSNAPKRRKK